MISREEALKFLKEKVKNENIVKHMIACEAIMRSLASKLKTQSSKFKTKEKIDEDEWGMAGLLHDGDYSEEVPQEKQGVQVTVWLQERGYEIPENVAQAMAAHNWRNTKVKPKSLMDWAIFCGDTLTGLIVATALVHPDKKLSSVKVKSVMKKFKDKAFARGTRREDIKLCEGKLKIPLREFVEIGLRAMQKTSNDLGL